MTKDCFQIYQYLDLSEENRKKIDEVFQALQTHFEPRKSEWVKVALRPSNAKRLYMDEKSTEKEEIIVE